jgi:cytochrome c-type biogenesis protein CcmF
LGHDVPVISEAVTGEKISVDARSSIGESADRVILLFLTGVGPLIAWRKSSFESLKRAFSVADDWAAVLTAALMVSGISTSMR